MTRSTRIPCDLADAATVHAARRQVMETLGDLAASPLDEHAADLMRRALDRVQSPEVRAAIRRLGRSTAPRPPLRVVPDYPPGERRGHPFPMTLAPVGGAA